MSHSKRNHTISRSRLSITVCCLAALATATPAMAAGPWQALPDVAPAPSDNPTTPAKVELGKMLYFDTRMSSSGNISCFSCHNVMEGGDDHRPTSIGVHGHVGGRNAPTVWNAAFLRRRLMSLNPVCRTRRSSLILRKTRRKSRR